MGLIASAPPFEVFSPAHWAVLAATVLIALALVYPARKTSAPSRTRDRALAAFLLLLYPTSVGAGWKLGILSQDNTLPCHLCDDKYFPIFRIVDFFGN